MESLEMIEFLPFSFVSLVDGEGEYVFNEQIFIVPAAIGGFPIQTFDGKNKLPQILVEI